MMNKQPFSVSICVYGKDDPQWFAKAVDSIRNQTVMPRDIVIVVDGPVPEELDSIIRAYEQDPLFCVIRFAKNSGHGPARRAGLEACLCEIVALMDADDVALPDRFEKQLAMWETDPDVAVVGGQITEFCGEESNIIDERRVPLTDADIKDCMRVRCPFNQMTVMLKKSAIQQAGGYLDWYCNEDYYLWLRLMLSGCRFMNVDDVLVNVRVGEDMMKRRGGVRYFLSEAKLQGFMLKNGVIGLGTYLVNVAKRFVVQLLLPTPIRAWVFQKFARNAVTE